MQGVQRPGRHPCLDGLGKVIDLLDGPSHGPHLVAGLEEVVEEHSGERATLLVTCENGVTGGQPLRVVIASKKGP